MPINYWASGVTSGEISLAIWLPAWLISTLVGQLVAYGVLMVWVYERTNGSLLVAMLMHASFAAFSFILFPPSAVVADLISGYAYPAALWVVVAVVALANRGYLSREPLRRRGCPTQASRAHAPDKGMSDRDREALPEDFRGR